MAVDEDAASDGACLDTSTPDATTEPARKSAGAKDAMPLPDGARRAKVTVKKKVGRKTVAGSGAAKKAAPRKRTVRKSASSVAAVGARTVRAAAQAGTAKRGRGSGKAQAVKPRKPTSRRLQPRGVSVRGQTTDCRLPLAEIDAQVSAVLLELMCASESDAVRVSAAKALMDQAKRNEEAADDEQNRQGREERNLAIAEIRRLMGELADAKSGGGADAHEVDQDGAGQSADP